MHWTVPVDAVRALVPEPLELDLYGGEAYVGIVPFLMRDIAPSWLPNAFGLDFLECNLRTYVHHEGQPGVWFFSLEASSWLAVKAARAGWGLPYHHARMSHHREGDEARFVTIRRSDGATLRTRYRVGEPLGPSEPGTREHFFLERYLLYSQRSGRIERGQVYHTPYPARRAEILEIEDSLVAAAGMPAVSGLPVLVHFADGVDVEVFAPRALSP